MFITWKEIYLLLKIPGTVGTRGKQREELHLEIVNVSVCLCWLHCVSAYMFVCVYIYIYVCVYIYVHTHLSIYTQSMFLLEVGVVSWLNEMFQGYVNRENLVES